MAARTSPMCLAVSFVMPHYLPQDARLPLSAFLPMSFLHNGIAIGIYSLLDLSLPISKSVRNVFGGWWFPLTFPLSFLVGCKILTFHLLLKQPYYCYFVNRWLSFWGGLFNFWGTQRGQFAPGVQHPHPRPRVSADRTKPPRMWNNTAPESCRVRKSKRKRTRKSRFYTIISPGSSSMSVFWGNLFIISSLVGSCSNFRAAVISMFCCCV